MLHQYLCAPKLPNLPIVGAKPGEWFPLLRAQWRNTLDMQTAAEIAYKEHRNRACIFPIAGGQNFVHLPREELQWLIIDSLQLDYTVTDPRLAHDPAHISIIAGLLTREIGNVFPEMLDEAQHSIDNIWGKDMHHFKEICVYDSVRRIVGQTTNRIFIGLPFCRNQDFIDTAMDFAADIPFASTLLHMIWRPLRPLAAPFITLPNRIHTNRFVRFLRPEIRRRLKEYDARRTDPEKKAVIEKNDFLQWSINQAKSLKDPYFSKVDTLAGRILIINFMAIHAAAFAMTHAVLDIAASKVEYVHELPEEITSVLAEHGGQWNKRTLAAISKLDSTMRESARLNSAVITATNRMVIDPKGITTPSGVHMPKGTMVSTPSFPVFHDPLLYPDPDMFKPFRFAEKRAISAEKGGSYIQGARQAWATTSPEYTAFGHGRHACPGRFFASSALKLGLAHMILNYDFDIRDKRPDNTWFSTNRVPPMEATIRIKRREAKC
ncbi:putative cytochrome P450 [Leptodontidium sp. 2 PMI_412]|nr:putative cytochrome P450 [Leptodontidium sp. 2 PMI_412]